MGGMACIATTGGPESNLYDTTPENEANAEFICKAVNSHELIVEALEKAKEQLWHPAAGEEGADRYRCQPSVCPACIVEAALEKVGK